MDTGLKWKAAPRKIRFQHFNENRAGTGVKHEPEDFSNCKENTDGQMSCMAKAIGGTFPLLGLAYKGSMLRLQVIPWARCVCPLTRATRNLGVITHPSPPALFLPDSAGSEGMALQDWTSVFLGPGQLEADTYGSCNAHQHFFPSALRV